MAVSPFDGANRIRFMGSHLVTLSRRRGSPETQCGFQADKRILELERCCCNLRIEICGQVNEGREEQT